MMSAASVFCDESMTELDRLRTANDMAQRLLLGNLQVFSEASSEPHESSAFVPPITFREMENRQKDYDDQTQTYGDLWGASEYLMKDTSIDYAKQHLQNAEAILRKTGTLLRVCHPGTYETVDDAESLTKKCDEQKHHSSDETKYHKDSAKSREVVVCDVQEDITLLGKKQKHQTLPKFHEHVDVDLESKLCSINYNVCGPFAEDNVGCGSIEISSNDGMGRGLEDHNITQILAKTPRYHGVSVETEDNHKFEMGLLNAILAENESTISSCVDLNLDYSSGPSESLTVGLRKDEPDSGLVPETILEEDMQQTPSLLSVYDAKTETSAVSDQEPQKENIFIPEFKIIPETSLKERLPQKLEPAQTSLESKNEEQKVLSMVDERESVLDLSLDLTLLTGEEDYERTERSLTLSANISISEEKLQCHPIHKLSAEAKKELSKYRPSILRHPIVYNTVWDMLPNEILLIIFSFLSQQDLKHMSLVCHRFYSLAKDNSLRSTAEAANRELTPEWLESFTRVRLVSFCRCKAKGLSLKVLRAFFQGSKDTLRCVHVSQCHHKSLFGDNVLLLISTHCRRVESICVPWSNTTDNGISALAMSNLKLRELDISGNCFISDSTFISLLRRTGSYLSTLKLNGCFALSNDSFLSVAEVCSDVSVLEIGFCSKVSGDCLVGISSSLRNLTELNLRGLKCVNDECLNSISKNSVNLVKLVIANCQLITDDGIAILAAGMPNIKDLDVSGCVKITDTGACSSANSLKSPLHLNFSGSSISHVTVVALTEHFYDSLQSLKISFCSNITQQCLEKLTSFCFKLKCLHVHGCKRLDVGALQDRRASLEICS